MDYIPAAGDAWEAADPVATGWSQPGLDRLAATVEGSNSTTFIMLAGGRILAEHYWGSAHAATLQDVASVQKSVTSTLLGIARDGGLLDFDDAVSDYLHAGWSKASAADEGRISLRHLMTMSSGLNPNTLRKVAEPGTLFDYNTDAYQKLRRVLENASGLGIDELSRQWLLDPIDVGSSAGWVERLVGGEPDATGEVPWGLRLTVRDMARFGLLALRGGRWADAAVTPDGWFAEAWTPSPAKRDYGLLWWLLGRGARGGRDAPPDWVGALGAGDQKVYVIPSLDLVMARQGQPAAEATEAGSSFDSTLIQGILAARL